jgi:ABC-2 type transport system permease protein
MSISNDQIRAILWAQLKVVYNRMSGGGSLGGRVVYWISMVFWYGLFSFLAWLAATTIPTLRSRETLATVLASILALGTLFWQLIPVLLASTGMSLDLRRLMVYPIPPQSLFGIEVLLRASTGVEVLIVLAGIGAGLAGSRLAPWYAPLLLIPFIVFNLALSAGVRDLLTRLLARRGMREVVVFLIVSISALPQLLVTFFPPEQWKHSYVSYLQRLATIPLPWQPAAALSAGPATAVAWLGLLGWPALAVWFGYSQFQRGLHWDASAVNASRRPAAPKGRASWMETFYTLPGRVFRDPLAALIEKELRFLSRAPRFRLVFFMGFSFGLIVWIPLVMGRHRAHGAFSDNILVWVSLYAALLLGDVLFWNNLGFDRMAAQAYWAVPVRFSTVLVAKNITAVFFLLAEITIVTAVVLALRIPFPPQKIPEAYAVTLLMCLFLLATGNLMSVYYPRPVDPAASWRQGSSGKVQGLVLLTYPLMAMPMTLAYLARYAFDSELAFYGVLGSGFVVAGMAYYISLDSAIETAERRREEILAALSRGEGPIG